MYEFMKTILSALQTWVNKRIKSNTPNWNENDSEADGYIKNRPFYTDGDDVVQIDEKYLPDSFHVQPDHSQNDEESFDYIKNRTHYYGEKMLVSTWIDNVTFTGFSNTYKSLTVEEVKLIPKLGEHKGWNINSLYTVVWDGVEYPNLTTHMNEIGGYDYPFIIGFTGRLTIRANQDYTSESHTISIYEYTDTVTITGTISELKGSSSVDVNFGEQELPKFIDGEIYHVEYSLLGQFLSADWKTAGDGQIYCGYSGDRKQISTGLGGYVELNSIYGSNWSSNPNRILLYSSDTVKDFPASITITISRGAKTLDETFIPNTIARLEQVPAIDTTLSIEGAAADAKAVGNVIDERIAAAKDYITFVDRVNGYTYVVEMCEGNIVSYCATKSIEVTTLPTKTSYVHGEYFDATGMVVTAICQDGSTKETTDFICPTTFLAEGATSVEISYVEAGITYTASVPVTVGTFDAATILVDFAYTDNGDGTYTITGWNGTYNGATSTEMIIPNYGCIIV